MNKITSPSRKTVSSAIARLMPNIIRGVQLDFFAKRSITQTQFLMVVAIHAYGRCSMSALARNMKIKMPTATGIVNRLAAAAYIRRFTDAKDRRKVMVELTPKGQQFIEAFRDVMRRRWEDVMRPLNDRDLREFYDVIQKLLKNFETYEPHDEAA